MAGGAWPGCHGVRLRASTDLGFARLKGEPLAEVDVDVAPVASVAAGAASEVWTVELADGAVAPASGVAPGSGAESGGLRPPGFQRLSRLPDGALVMGSADRHRFGLSADRKRVTLDPPYDAAQAQVLASFALPLVVQSPSRVVFHASAVARGGRAVLVVGVGGAGKSSLLVRLTDAGWAPMTEDVCVVEMDGHVPRAWPGPPWVRVHTGERGPAAASTRFVSGLKTAWSLPGQPAGPVAVATLILLERSGASRVRAERLGPAAALPALAAHAVWLGDPDDRSRGLFSPLASAARRIEVVRLSVPTRPDWFDVVRPAVEDLVGG